MQFLYSAENLMLISLGFMINSMMRRINYTPLHFLLFKSKEKDRKKKDFWFRIKLDLKKKKLKLTILVGKKFITGKDVLIKVILTIILCLLSIRLH
jgi:hypothetical protein